MFHVDIYLLPSIAHGSLKVYGQYCGATFQTKILKMHLILILSVFLLVSKFSETFDKLEILSFPREGKR
jgi:hypothetical protein